MFQTPLQEAQALIVKGDFDEALNVLSEFLNGDFFNPEALFMFGACLMEKGKNGLAAVITSAAIDARAAQGQAFPEALLNLGGAYKNEHQHATAARVWDDALRHETLPRERAKIMVNIAGLHLADADAEQAIAWCDRALAEDPQCDGARANRGMACLLAGHWREGWEGWSHTYASGDRQRRRYGERVKIWDGRAGQHVIVWGDQGVGDEIYYAQSLRDLGRMSRQVTFDCHPRLEALFRRSFPDFTVHGTRKHLTALDWLPDCDADAAVALADLPGFFRNSADDWGNGGAYLRADPGWHGLRPAPVVERGWGIPPRIGISWSGGSKKTRADLRSIPLAQLEPILRSRPDAQWFSLQYTPEAARQVCELEERCGVRIAHFPGWVECHDYDRTASFVASLDLVVTVCTSIHHLAGALGVPVWTLVPSRPSWRYGGKSETLPWYNSARLFRQERDGDWSAPIARVAAALAG